MSLSALSVLPCSPLDQIEAAACAGFDAVGLRLIPATPTDLDVLADSSLMQQIERHLLKKSIKVFDIEVIRVGPDTEIASYRKALHFASCLGAECVTMTSLMAQDYRPEDERELLANIFELCEMAKTYGIKPMLEFMPYRGVRNLPEASRILKLVAHENLGICIDALHFYRSGGSLKEISAMNIIDLCCVQLCDARRLAPKDIQAEALQDRMYPGEGELPLRELLSMVPTGVPLCLEAPSLRRARQTPIQRAVELAECARRLLA